MNKKGYFVPLKVPKYCNKCPFGFCVYSSPFWAHKSICDYDMKENEPNTQGYICYIHKFNNNYSKVMRVKFGEDVEKPSWCPLKEMELKEDE